MPKFEGIEISPCYEEGHISDTRCLCAPLVLGKGAILIHNDFGDDSMGKWGYGKSMPKPTKKKGTKKSK